MMAAARFLAMALAMLALAAAAAAESTPTISVSGNAEIRVEPDEAVLVFGVEAMEMDMPAARRAVEAAQARAVEFLRANGIEPEDIRTDRLDASPQWRHRDGERHFLGYQVRQSTAVTIRDMAQVSGLVAGVLESGATHIHDLSFRTTELRRHRDEARRLAVRAAREKAEDMAGELGVAVGPPIRIDEGSARHFLPSPWGWAAGGMMMQNVVQVQPSAGGSGDGAIALGRITVTAEVSITFRLEVDG